MDLRVIRQRLGISLGPRLLFPLALFAALLLMPTPQGLTPQGQRTLSVVALTVGLWVTGGLPLAASGVLAVLLLVGLRAVPSLGHGLEGFRQPVVYFLIGVLVLGVAVHRSGLAQRAALLIIGRAGGSPRWLFLQMLGAFAALTYFLPSATTRNAIMVHIYDQVLEVWQVRKGAHLARAIMLGMASLNRLASTAILTGGITPVAAAGLIKAYGGQGSEISWTRWFLLMAPPYYALLALGGLLLYLLHRQGFSRQYPRPKLAGQGLPVGLAEVKVAVAGGLAALLWFTDFAHPLPPAVPALVAAALVSLPVVGVLRGRDLARGVHWASVIVLITALTLAHDMVDTGVARWLAQSIVEATGSLAAVPVVVLLVMMAGGSLVRLLVPTEAGYLAMVLPVGMDVASQVGMDPVVVALSLTIAGDAMIYYAAQGASVLVIFVRGHFTSLELMRFGFIMNATAFAVVVFLALPYWALVGAPLVR